jgi:cytochrome c oxidase assembly factor CtaG
VARPSPIDPTLSPLLLAFLAGLMALVAVRVRAAHRRAEALGVWRRASLLVAVALVAVALVSPLATLSGGYLLTAHFVQITLLMGFAPPLLLLGLPRPDPHPRAGALAWVFGAAVHPAVAIVLVNVVLFGWHDPAIYDASLAHPELYALELMSLFAVSVAFWWSIIEPDGRGAHSLSPLLKLGYILLATIPQTFAGLIFALAHHPFYAGYSSAPEVLGMTHLADQQIAGACMALVSKLALFAAFSVILWRMFDAEAVEGEAPDDGGDGGGGDDDHEPAPVRPPSPAWLRLLDTGPMADEPAAPERLGDPVLTGR